MPVPRVLGERAIELCIRPERVEEGSLVVRASPHPAVCDARPLGDGIALSDEVVAGAGRLEEAVCEAAVSRVRRRRQDILGLLVVQRIVEQLPLGPFALGDVGLRARNASRPSLLIPHRDSAR